MYLDYHCKARHKAFLIIRGIWNSQASLVRLFAVYYEDVECSVVGDSNEKPVVFHWTSIVVTTCQ